ncbi:MAG TPA: hypothetical protein VJ727_00270 [Rhodanobacteraceae bacterium]|nr:hypothetical protein [Rhodanobacteraceae bacterium]
MTQRSLQAFRLLAKLDWFRAKQNDGLHISVYEMEPDPEIVVRRRLEFDRIVVLIEKSAVSFLELGNTSFKFGQNREVTATVEQRHATSSNAGKVIFLQPYKLDQQESEKRCDETAEQYLSLLISTNRRNIAYRHLFTNIIGYEGDATYAQGRRIRLPFASPPPDLSENSLNLFITCERALRSKDAAFQRRVELSLHWHMRGIRLDSVDSFLSLWIAIEALSMDTSDIKPVNEALAAIYNLSYRDAAEKFAMGRVYGLRSDIVHKGRKDFISTGITDYLECVYTDLLLNKLGITSLRRAEEFIRAHDFDLRSAIGS